MTINLQSDCENCFGLCCIALYFSASEGFPVDKEIGQPCHNLQLDFRCGIHPSLREHGLKGCNSFECFGAGQKVAQYSFEGQDWRKTPESAKQMCEVFLIMRQLHELLSYLAEALTLKATEPIHASLRSMLEETERFTYLQPQSLIKLNVEEHRAQVDTLLLKTSERVRTEARLGRKALSARYKTLKPRANLIGADLRKRDMVGANLRGACLIAADLRGMDLSGTDFIGADFRDADLSGANLTKSLFLTQAQINVAKGDASTMLPSSLIRPTHWGNNL